eukprot:403333631
MDILDLHEEIKNLKFNGLTLNLDERVQLEAAIMKLQTTWRCEEMQFWGKIQGLQHDYFIVVGQYFSAQYEFPFKKFFWALSKDFEFQEMPPLNDQHKDAINQIISLFSGNPKKKLINLLPEGEEGQEAAADEIPAEDGAEEGKQENLSDISEEEEIKIPPKDLTELDRLVYVVYAIENDCCIAPAGAYKMTPTHQVRRNEAFRGLPNAQAHELRSYLHFRNVQDSDLKQELDKPSAPFNPRFLEAIPEDSPVGVWTIQADGSNTTVLLRNLLWPGYGFYHKAGTKKFGQMYIGDGIKNDELHFMIQ